MRILPLVLAALMLGMTVGVVAQEPSSPAPQPTASDSPPTRTSREGQPSPTLAVAVRPQVLELRGDQPARAHVVVENPTGHSFKLAAEVVLDRDGFEARLDPSAAREMPAYGRLEYSVVVRVLDDAPQRAVVEVRAAAQSEPYISGQATFELVRARGPCGDRPCPPPQPCDAEGSCDGPGQCRPDGMSGCYHEDPCEAFGPDACEPVPPTQALEACLHEGAAAFPSRAPPTRPVDDGPPVAEEGTASGFRLREGAEVLRACCAQGRDDADVRQRCAALLERLRSKHVTYVPMEDGHGFEAYDVGGLRVIDRARYHPAGSSPDPAYHADGARIAWDYRDGGRIALHDGPNGLLSGRFPGVLVVEFPEGASLRPGGAGWYVESAQWRGMVMSENATVEGRIFTAQTDILFYLKVSDTLERPMPTALPAREVRERVDEAVQRRGVGAEIVLRPGAADSARIYHYDDVEVQVRELPDRATPDTPILVEFSAELKEGRTIVIDIDPALVEGELVLRYWDVEYVNGTRYEAEVVFEQADSLEDVLDATNDGIQPEYWIVRDDDGLHILVSAPTWSTHAVTVASLGEIILQPSVLVGIAAGAVGTLLAAVALLLPRRRKDA